MIGKLVMDNDGRLGFVSQKKVLNRFAFYDVEYLIVHPIHKEDKCTMIDYATLQFWLDNYVKYRKANGL